MALLFRFVSPELPKLEALPSEVLALPCYSDERPPRGVLGLLDYRLGGTISDLMQKGTITGSPLEQVILSARPKLPFDRLLVIGLGARDEFHEQLFAVYLDLLLNLLSDSGVRRAVVELPGRAADRIEPALAMKILSERAKPFGHLDVWTLIERPEAAKIMGEGAQRDRRGDWGV